MLSGLFVQVLHADEIRHTTFPNVILGTGAETAEQCAASAKLKALVNAGEFLGWVIAAPRVQRLQPAPR